MGAALTRAAQWTAAGIGAGKLEFTPLNVTLLNDIIKFVENMSSKYPQEAALMFREPLEWSTGVEVIAFGSDYELSNETLVSKEKIDGIPLLNFQSSTGIIKVYAFNQLAKFLEIAQKEKLKETQACLEANRDPIAKILGPSFATVEGEDSSMLRLLEKVKKGDEDPQAEVQMKLFLLLQQLDMQLLNTSLQKISQEVRLSPQAIKNDVQLLQSFSGEEDKSVLKSIKYTSEYVFSNGCRAPPWRQVYGDICYLIIVTHDMDVLYVTCSTAGVFENGGFKKDSEDIIYDRKGDIYKDLITFLRVKSPTFAENLTQIQQNFALQKKLTATRKTLKTEVPTNDEMDLGEKFKDYQDKNKLERNRQSAKFKIKDAKKEENILKIKESSHQQISKDDKTQQKDQTAGKIKQGKENDEMIPTRRYKCKESKERKFSLKRIGSLEAEDMDESSTDSEEEQQDMDRQQESSTDLPSEYWQIQKVVKYLKGGNQTATVIALCSMKDFNLSSETCQLAIRDVGGLEVLINLLDTDDIKCKVGLLNCDPILSSNLTAEQKKDIEVARCGALALWSCSKSKKNKEEIRRSGGIPLLGQLLKSPHENMLIPVVGTLQECASEPSYSLAIRTENMIKDLVRNLSSESEELQMHCACAIFKCGEDEETRNLVRAHNGLEPLVKLFNRSDNKELLAAATGAVWKCAISMENVDRFKNLRIVETLIHLLVGQPEEVLINVVGALGQCARDRTIRAAIRKSEGIEPLVNLLTGTNNALLVNVTKAVGECAVDPENMAIIESLDGVRLLWSLLKKPNPDIQSSAAWAICPCIENAKEAGEMVRSFVGGLELIVNLLKSDNIEVLASVCAALAKIAMDEENLAVITDHAVVPMLSSLTYIKDDMLRQHLADAIACCCKWGNNRVAFGQTGAVAPLVHYLESKNPLVHRATAKALHQLSFDPKNCITMHENGVVRETPGEPPGLSGLSRWKSRMREGSRLKEWRIQLLLNVMECTDGALQEAAAGCISNIRRLALANEKAHYK
ncbi:outer dynein arm-docking complex subunit 2 isoform X4 [Hypanus sabinus]|uniref:outer dynein arm-docking complex subunit 2 isoform X4 n=1 Tax=Hypanus sabinus TaxID=79690 RepID=UPI0028C4AA80|nr:outer dynein arm-docking complex subunit 2 isoform X4 [Hypanus sabinus]